MTDALARMTQAEARRLVTVIESLPRFHVEGIQRDGDTCAVIQITDALTSESHAIACMRDWTQIVRRALGVHAVKEKTMPTTLPEMCSTTAPIAPDAATRNGPLVLADGAIRLPEPFDWERWGDGLRQAIESLDADLEALRLLRSQIDERVAQLADAARRLRRAAQVAPQALAAIDLSALPGLPRASRALPPPQDPQDRPVARWLLPGAADPDDMSTWRRLPPRWRCRLWAAAHRGEVRTAELAAALIAADIGGDEQTARNQLNSALAYAVRQGEFIRVDRGHYRLAVPSAPPPEQSVSDETEGDACDGEPT